ncbi:hypothetical protein SteCoe_10870 [Stentor coeruleus]|uniref:non-specific serine/threonine protein kinase n=1 Tax=Stentor coeruleus TaxID=5963 RepID=A0A1R2CES5_9CILI|nr:hypothetical protein SteCoe_10870 [Stentor coeruleus]
MGSICSREPTTYTSTPKLKSQNYLITKEEELAFSPGIFVRENGACFNSVYDVDDKSLGSGRNGEVKKCKHIATNDVRVVKIIRKADLPQKMIETRAVFKEVEILKTVDHPNMPRIYEFFEDEINFYIVLELCTGGDLFDKILEFNIFTESQAAEIMFQILSGLTYLHSKSIVHRDIKPENILLSNKNTLSLKIIDYDTATFFGSGFHREMFGTPLYMAPEIVKGRYTEKCDLWSCGMIMLILLIGRPPYDGTDEEILQILKNVNIDIENLCPGVSEEAKSLLKSLLEADPDKRISAKEACLHPWIKSYTQSVSQKDISKVLLRMKSFKRTSKLREAIHTFIISKIMDPNIYSKEQKVFNFLDVNRDGTISSKELAELLKKELPAEEVDLFTDTIMQHVDSDKSGQIDYTEFLKATINYKKVCTKENLLRAFKFFDEDGNGTIEYSELSSALTDGAMITQELIQELMSQVDTNQDGKIDLDEFESLLFDALNVKKGS